MTQQINLAELKETAEFWDHCKNLTNAANAHATARVRREAIAEGTAWTAYARKNEGQAWFYWNGGFFDITRYARDLRLNRYEVVVVDNKDEVR